MLRLRGWCDAVRVRVQCGTVCPLYPLLFPHPYDLLLCGLAPLRFMSSDVGECARPKRLTAGARSAIAGNERQDNHLAPSATRAPIGFTRCSCCTWHLDNQHGRKGKAKIASPDASQRLDVAPGVGAFTGAIGIGDCVLENGFGLFGP